MLRLAVKVLFGQKLTDEATCYKAFRRTLINRMDLECQRFEFCPEVTAKAIRMGETIKELPITYEPRTKAAGKKIRWTDAPEAFVTLWRYRKWRETQK
jgi:dolichol-phosphate mannosyltransferase